MECPHCQRTVIVDWDRTDTFGNTIQNLASFLEFGQCPGCEKIIVKLISGGLEETSYGYRLRNEDKEEIIYPSFSIRPVADEVPEPYKCEFEQASKIVNLSSLASAALSRRILQRLLNQEYKLNKGNLNDQISEFCELDGVPSDVIEIVDAIRRFGNYAAHPVKDITGEVIDIEPKEAESLLEILELLFDCTFIRPKRNAERKERLNKKLREAGKSEIK